VSKAILLNQKKAKTMLCLRLVFTLHFFHALVTSLRALLIITEQCTVLAFFFVKYKGIFVWFMTMWKKGILARGIRIKKMGGNSTFSEIIELKLGKKMPQILCLLKPF